MRVEVVGANADPARNDENDAARLEEMRQRLINIEVKLNVALKLEAPAFSGHRHQAFGHLSYSQHGEDLIFAQVLNRLGVHRPTYLDVGAHHPVEISNTALLYSRGARGVNIEANPNLIKNFEAMRPGDVNVNVGVGPTPGVMPFYCVDELSGRNTFDKQAMDIYLASHPQEKIKKIIEVKIITIAEALDLYCKGVWPDLLSIDIEGLDYPVLEEADFSKTRPKIICVEITTPDGTLGGIPAMRDLMGRKAYKPYALAHGNAIFLSDEAHAGLEFF